MRWNHDIDIDAKPAAAAAGNTTTDETSETDEAPTVPQENADAFTIPIVEPKKPARRMGNRKTAAK